MKQTHNNTAKREATEIFLPKYDFGDADSEEWMEKFAQAQLETARKYNDIATAIVAISKAQLSKQNQGKKKLREEFTPYFKWLIVVQLGFLAVLLLLKGFLPCFKLNDVIIITYITSVFVETLGGVIVMITYAFNSKEEVEATKILTGVIEHYQK